MQLRFVLKKDLKSKGRRINLKWILLNQLKWILDKLFRILLGWYQPTQLYLRVAFSSSVQASSFLICVGNSQGQRQGHHAKTWVLMILRYIWWLLSKRSSLMQSPVSWHYMKISYLASSWFKFLLTKVSSRRLSF